MFGGAIDTSVGECERTAAGGEARDGNVGASMYGESARVEVVDKGAAPVCGFSARGGRAFSWQVTLALVHGNLVSLGA